MFIDYREYFQALYETTTRVPLNASRLKVLLPFALGFPPFEAMTAGCLALDHLVHPDFPKTEVRQPVFIVGNPRSGTTFLHRLIAMDDALFCGYRLFEIFLPALTQQQALNALEQLDEMLGAPVKKAIEKVQSNVSRVADHIHKTRLTEPEEDEILLLHRFATPVLFMLMPGAKVLHPYMEYDELPPARRHTLDQFYRSCVQRLLYRQGQGRRFLSKNTTFTTKIRAISETFPDARFIYVIRNPAVSIASTAAMFNTAWTLQLGHDRVKEQHQRLFERACYLYRHALQELDKLPKERWCVVHYEALVAHPEETVKNAYQALELPLSEEFQAKLSAATRKARSYKSEHHYSLDQFSLTEEMVRQALPEVYSRFEFTETVGHNPQPSSEKH